ncbi:MAG: YggS family pyridoxal phosphate-dependent enzyme [Ectothiorhodospiraceae bacterium]
MTDPDNAIGTRIAKVERRIREAEIRYHRPAGSVSLLAVSKTQPAEAIRAAVAAGQRAFGENYLQEALRKIDALADVDLQWHFIGPLQSNKSKPVAERFDWIHTIDRLKVAKRLSEQRPAEKQPLQCCIQVNVSGEASKSGVEPGALRELAEQVAELPGLRLRGLMALPAPETEFERQRRPLRQLREQLENLQAAGLALDTLSMGMSSDLEAAIAEGSTLVRVGTDIFGPRRY